MTEEQFEQMVFVNDRACIIFWTAICGLYPCDGDAQENSTWGIHGLVGFICLFFPSLLYVVNACCTIYVGGSSNDLPYVEEDALGQDVSFRKEWYPGEIFVFRIERLLMCILLMYVLYHYVFHDDGKLDHRVMQYPSYIVFPATNLFFFVSANPDCIQPDSQELNEKPEQNKKETTDNASAVKQVIVTITEEEEAKLNSEHDKLKKKYNKLCSAHYKLKEENNKLSLELVAAKSQYEAYYKLVTNVINEGLHDKCKEERNSLLNELNVAKASCETCLNRLLNYRGS